MSQQIHNFRLQQLQHEVARAALTGVACDEIDERVIDRSSASEEEKAALRLFACSFFSRFDLRRLALGRLANLSSTEVGQLPLVAGSSAGITEDERGVAGRVA